MIILQTMMQHFLRVAPKKQAALQVGTSENASNNKSVNLNPNKTIGSHSIQNFKNMSVDCVYCTKSSTIQPLNAQFIPTFNGQGLRARAKPNLGVLSKALVSNSPDIVRMDFGFSSCWRRAPSLPELLSLAFTVVWGSSACCPPTVIVFSLVENLLTISATTELFCISSKWYTYEALRVSPLSALMTRVLLVKMPWNSEEEVCDKQQRCLQNDGSIIFWFLQGNPSSIFDESSRGSIKASLCTKCNALGTNCPRKFN